MTDNIYKIKKGVKKPLEIKLKKTDETTGESIPIDLTGSVIKFQIKDELKDENYIISKTITETSDVYSVGRITDAKNGTIITRFTDDDYNNLVVSRIYYIVIWWIKEDEDFAEVVSGTCDSNLKFTVCYP